MKILVTGANGYLGKGIVKELLDRGLNIIATDLRDDYIDKRANVVCADLFKIDNPYEFFGQPDVLVHLAWRDGFIHDSDNHIGDLPKHFEFIRNMIEYRTTNKVAGNAIKKIVVMGSMHEVGFYEGSIKEDTPCNPLSKYGISKNALRRLVELECKKNNVLFQWLRGFYIVGNSIDGSSIFSKIVQAEKEGRKEFPFTMGLNQFDFLDYEVFCKYVVDAIVQDSINGIINICKGRPERLAERVERFIKDNEFNIILKYGAFLDRPYDSKAIWGDDTKLKNIQKQIEG